jgi:2',3'-cyclic-nucleotide 2'-phosphodiesterase (5'-nucleotidase family)
MPSLRGSSAGAIAHRMPAVVFFQLNDIYHIDAKSDYTNPALLIFPRIATVLKRARSVLKKQNIPSYLCVPGDFIAPSCLSKSTYGKHMIDLLNILGTAFVTFGNHEFETFKGSGTTPPLFPLVDIIEHSKFKWVSSNFDFASHPKLDTLRSNKKVVSHSIIPLSPDHDLALLGLLYEQREPNEFHGYGSSHNPVAAAQRRIAELDASPDKPSYRSYVGLTHQYLADDKHLARALHRMPLLMGGHDHSVTFPIAGLGALIVKARSDGGTIRINWIIELSGQLGDLAAEYRSSHSEASRKALTAYFMKEYYLPIFRRIITGSDTKKGPQLLSIAKHIYDFVDPAKKDQEDPTRGIPEPPQFALFKAGDRHLAIFTLGLNPSAKGFVELIPEDPVVKNLIEGVRPSKSAIMAPIIRAPQTLLVRDNDVRRSSTNFGNLVADILAGQLREPTSRCDIGIINSGSFRIDRNIEKNEPISRHTLCEIFFHANDIRQFVLTGEKILELLRHSLTLRNKNPDEGNGEFLQVSGLLIDVVGTAINKVTHVTPTGDHTPLDKGRSYSIATTTFVATRCSEYNPFFTGQTGPLIENDIEVAIAKALASLPPDIWPKVELPRWRGL